MTRYTDGLHIFTSKEQADYDVAPGRKYREIPEPDEIFPEQDIAKRVSNSNNYRRTDTPQSIQSSGDLSPQRDKGKTKPNKEFSKSVYAMDLEGICDVLDDGEKLVYLTNSGDIKENVIEKDKNGVITIFTPPPKEAIPYLLPDKETVLNLIKGSSDSSDSDLYTHLLDYHKSLSDLPNELFYDLLVLWDFHTYLLDRLHFSPILYLYAVKERGKSRTGKGCIYVSRRGVFTETVREPDIIRWGNDHKACIGFDVKDFPKKIERANCDDLLLARFERGSTSSRTLWPEKGAFMDTKTFNLFGPTIVMTNRPVDDILESRSISIDMKPSYTRFNNPVLAENALDLKAELMAFRYRHQNTPILEVDKPTDGRLGDILSPLYNIVVTFFPEKMEAFNNLLEIIINQKKESATDTFEAQLVEVVVSAEAQVVEGFLAIDLIASLFNEGKDEKFAIRNETIGRILKGLGFNSRRTTGGKRGIYYDPELVKNLAYQYGLIQVPVTTVPKEDKNQVQSDSNEGNDSNIPLKENNNKEQGKGNDVGVSKHLSLPSLPTNNPHPSTTSASSETTDEFDFDESNEKYTGEIPDNE